MHKKLITACMALAAFVAFAVMPATASAANDPQLTDEGGKTLAKGAKIIGTSAGETFFTNTSGTTLVTCSAAAMTGEVIKNEGGTVEGTIMTSDFSGTGTINKHNELKECTGSFGNAYITVTGHQCVRSTPAMAEHEFQVHKGTCGGAEEKVEFVIGSTTIGPCEYKATGNIKGDYTTGGAQTSMTVRHTQAGSGAELVSGGFFCPASGMLKMTFTLETDDGKSTPVITS